VLRDLPPNQTDFHHAEPVYEEFDGWREDITGATSFADLPKNAQTYVRALEEMSGAPFSVVGVGPGRDQTIVLRDLV
jgi:adenylosuccinate synthase